VYQIAVPTTSIPDPKGYTSRKTLAELNTRNVFPTEKPSLPTWMIAKNLFTKLLLLQAGSIQIAVVCYCS